MFNFFRELFSGVFSDTDRRLLLVIQSILGGKPDNLELYRLALVHSSASQKTFVYGFRESNERLEFLGDAVLGMVVGEYLYKKYPFKDEGFLTDIRSRIVNRESLNYLASRIGLNEILRYDINRKSFLSSSSMYGDALEALVGAVYLDKGFEFCQKFIVERLLIPNYDLDDVIQNIQNYKSKIIEWAQSEGKKVEFKISEEGNSRTREFLCELFVNDIFYSNGNGLTKKKSEQNAAMRAYSQIKQQA